MEINEIKVGMYVVKRKDPLSLVYTVSEVKFNMVRLVCRVFSKGMGNLVDAGLISPNDLEIPSRRQLRKIGVRI